MAQEAELRELTEWPKMGEYIGRGRVSEKGRGSDDRCCTGTRRVDDVEREGDRQRNGAHTARRVCEKWGDPTTGMARRPGRSTWGAGINNPK